MSENTEHLHYPPFEAYQGDAPYIFVSYAHKDKRVVYPEIIRLHQIGYRIWYDEGITPGSEWSDEIGNAIEKCNTFVVFISPCAIESENVRKEIHYAIKKKNVFLAIHLKETQLPPGLDLQMSMTQAVLKYTLREEHYQRKIKQVLSEITLEKKVKKALQPQVEKVVKEEIRSKKELPPVQKQIKSRNEKPRNESPIVQKPISEEKPINKNRSFPQSMPIPSNFKKTILDFIVFSKQTGKQVMGVGSRKYLAVILFVVMGVNIGFIYRRKNLDEKSLEKEVQQVEYKNIADDLFKGVTEEKDISDDLFKDLTKEKELRKEEELRKAEEAMSESNLKEGEIRQKEPIDFIAIQQIYENLQKKYPQTQSWCEEQLKGLEKEKEENILFKKTLSALKSQVDNLKKQQSKHFLLYSEWDEPTNSDYLWLWEKVLQDFCKFWEIESDKFFGGQQCQFILFNSGAAYVKYIQSLAVLKQLSKIEQEMAMKTWGFYYWNKKNKKFIGGKKFVGYRSYLKYIGVKDEEIMPSHEDFKPATLGVLGLQLLDALKPNSILPNWLNYGFASYCEFKYFKKVDSFVFINDQPYESGSTITTGRTLDEGWEHGEDWHDLLKETLENEELANFSTILNMDLSAMTHREFAHTWSMVSFLIEIQPDKFKAFVHKMIAEKNSKGAQIRILKEVFNWSPKEFEAEWHKYLRTH